MRSYICQSCGSSIIVGPPRSALRRKAKALAREAYSFFDRLLHRGQIMNKLTTAMEERFYLEPHRYQALPSACPKCGFRSQGERLWWTPGLSV